MKKNLFLFCILFVAASLVFSQTNVKNFIANPGEEEIVDYEKYGKFIGVGTSSYKYVIKDKKGLIKAVGEGIYPDEKLIYKDPTYKRLKKKGKLEGDPWKFVHRDKSEQSLCFYKWATTKTKEKVNGEIINVPIGIKMYFTALALEKYGLIKQAIKAYYALVVHYPKTFDWTFFHTPWYPARVAMDRIYMLCRRNPNLKIKYINGKMTIKNGFDNDPSNDVFVVNPGKLIKLSSPFIQKRENLSNLNVVKSIGNKNITLVQYENRHWQLKINGKPTLIKAVAYTPNKVSLSPDEGTLCVYKDWMLADYNNNGKADGPYDAWVDKNGNNLQDTDEPTVGDFQLMKDMGVNAVRLYHHGFDKELLRDLYENYGIMVLMGDYLGMYTVGANCSWATGCDYRNEKHRKNMINSVLEMVNEYKDEPYVLMWVLGNENNYGVACNAPDYPEVYYSFVNEVAKKIKEIDPSRPVAISNGDVLYLDLFAKYCPDVDIYGLNSYRGKIGFGQSLWESVKALCDKPVLITEYGCPAYHKGKSSEVAEKEQAEYHWGCWEDIENNSYGLGEGNAIGGVIFEWTDEWWKASNPSIHDEKPRFKGPFPDGWLYEEWLGVCSQGDGKSSPFLRQIRKVYYMYQEMWK